MTRDASTTSEFWKLLEQVGAEHERELLAARNVATVQPFGCCLTAPLPPPNGKAITWASAVRMEDVVVSYEETIMDTVSDPVPFELESIKETEVRCDAEVHSPRDPMLRSSNSHAERISESARPSVVASTNKCESSHSNLIAYESEKKSEILQLFSHTASSRRPRVVLRDESADRNSRNSRNSPDRNSGKYEVMSIGSADTAKFDSLAGVDSKKSIKRAGISIVNTLSIYDCADDDENYYATCRSSAWSNTDKCIVFTLRPEWEKPGVKSVRDRKTLPTFSDRLSSWASRVRTSVLSDPLDLDIDEPKNSGKSFYAKYLLSHPRSRRRICWDVLAMILIGYDCVNIPLQVFPLPDVLIMVMMTWFIRVFWTLDMFASVCVCYYRKGRLVTSFQNILMRYLKTWFALDSLLVGIDWFIAAEELREESTAGGSVASIGKSLRVVRFMRTLRLLRLVKLKRIVRQMHDRIESEVVSVYFSVSVTLLQLLAINHMVACAWYGISTSIGKNGDTGENWVNFYKLDGASVWYLYTTSLHWSLTQFTPASMDVGPTNSVERFFTVTIVMLGLVIFSSFVGRITNSTAQLWNKEAHKHRQLWLLRRYLRKNDVDKGLSSRIQQYLEYVMDQENDAVRAQDIPILGKLSDQLRQELILDVYEASLQRQYIFGFLRENYGRLQYRKGLDGAITSELYAKGDVLFFGGEVAESLICIVEGDMLYKRPWDFCSQAVEQGTWICEGTMWTTWMHIGDMRTIMESTILVLRSSVVSKNIQKIPSAWKKIRVFGARYVTSLNSCEEKQLTDLANPHFECPTFNRGNHMSKINRHSIGNSLRRWGCFWPMPFWSSRNRGSCASSMSSLPEDDD